MSTHERQLLNAVLAGREPLLEALMAWKEGAALEEELRRRRLLDPGEGTVDDQGTGVHVSGDGAGPINRVFGERYRKIRPHAKGALGEVFVAHDEELERDVALKEIQSHRADDAGSQERFVREARLTGQLEHPGIVPVYGLGLYPDGRPYYAMRFIEGEPLSEAIKKYHGVGAAERPLALRQLLGRFVAMCNAVGYAHSRGVIHRDIKPDNVMLGAFGETLVVDWGLARKASGGRESPVGGNEAAQAGGTIGVLGTPAYMPPEQASGDHERVGSHSDIYALGATLYHILTGRAPIAPGALGDMLRRVEQREFPTPRQVKADVPRALEAVVLKAMAERSEDRYATAQELAAEVERWLADEPVTAYREPAWDRLRRWGRKRRTLVTSGVAVLLVSVVALVLGIVLVGAEQRRTAKALERAVEAEETATANLKQSEANLKLAKTAVNDTFDLAKNHRLFRHAGSDEIRKLLLEKALPFYRKFDEVKGNDRRTQAELADQYSKVGYITNKIDNKTEARRAYRQAEGIWRKLVKANPEIREYQHELAGTLNALGALLEGEGKRTEALQAYRQALEIGENLVKTSPAASEYQNQQAATMTNLAIFLKAEGKRSEALKLCEQARDIREKLIKADPENLEYQHELAGTLNVLGDLLEGKGKRNKALKAFTQARDIREKLVRTNPEYPKHWDELATTMNNLGTFLKGEGKRSEALKAFTQARDVGEKLVKISPKVTGYQRALAQTLHNLGVLLDEDGKRGAAAKAYSQAREIREKLVKANPKVTEYQNDLASTLYNIAFLLFLEGMHADALKVCIQAKNIRSKLVKDNPSVTEYQSSLGRTLNNLGIFLEAEGKQSAALKAYSQARDIWVKLVKDNPAVTEYQDELGLTLNNIGKVLQVEGKQGAALKAYSQARDIRVKLVKDNPTVPRYRTALADTCGKRGSLYDSMKKPKEALADFSDSIRHAQVVFKADSRSAQARHLLWVGSYSRAHTLEQLKRHSDALTDWDRAIKLGPMKNRFHFRCREVQCLAHAGKHRTALTRARQLAKSVETGEDWYNQSCIAALVSAGASADNSRPLIWREQFAEQAAQQAVKWLHQARKAGFFNTAANRMHFATDPDLAALRHRDDFKAFLKTLTPDD